jgi:hypothetical protein
MAFNTLSIVLSQFQSELAYICHLFSRQVQLQALLKQPNVCVLPKYWFDRVLQILFNHSLSDVKQYLSHLSLFPTFP